MVFDNEEQRQIILSAIMTNPISGTFGEIAANMPKIQAVVDAIKTAEIKPQAEEDAKPKSK